jgi:hypothetical protein
VLYTHIAHSLSVYVCIGFRLGKSDPWYRRVRRPYLPTNLASCWRSGWFWYSSLILTHAPSLNCPSPALTHCSITCPSSYTTLQVSDMRLLIKLVIEHLRSSNHIIFSSYPNSLFPTVMREHIRREKKKKKRKIYFVPGKRLVPRGLLQSPRNPVEYRRHTFSVRISHSPITLANLSSINFVSIFRCSSPPHNPVYTSRVDPSVLGFNLSSHRHSYVSLLCSSRVIG